MAIRFDMFVGGPRKMVDRGEWSGVIGLRGVRAQGEGLA